jgi:hypothetical protein
MERRREQRNEERKERMRESPAATFYPVEVCFCVNIQAYPPDSIRVQSFPRYFHSQAHNTVLNSLPILHPHPVLGLIINIDGYLLRIFSIYGPNFDNKAFYNRIDYFLSQDSQVAAVLGGDWNSSYSTSPTADNIDIRNMRNPPPAWSALDGCGRSATTTTYPIPSGLCTRT